MLRRVVASERETGRDSEFVSKNSGHGLVVVAAEEGGSSADIVDVEEWNFKRVRIQAQVLV